MTDPAGKAVYKVLINAPIETVWSTLVKTDEVLPFFFGAVCETDGAGLRRGARMRMVSRDRKFAAVVGEVLEFEPPHRYAHTFKFTQFDDAPCIVRYELKETPEGVEFLLITENAPAGSQTEKAMAQGGPFITGNLKSLCETGRPAFSGRMVLLMNPLMALLTPARCRIEHWPLDRPFAAQPA